MARVAHPQREARTTHLELEDPPHGRPSNEAEGRPRQAAELHQPATETALAVQANDVSPGSGVEGVEASNHGFGSRDRPSLLRTVLN